MAWAHRQISSNRVCQLENGLLFKFQFHGKLFKAGIGRLTACQAREANSLAFKGVLGVWFTWTGRRREAINYGVPFHTNNCTVLPTTTTTDRGIVMLLQRTLVRNGPPSVGGVSQFSFMDDHGLPSLPETSWTRPTTNQQMRWGAHLSLVVSVGRQPMKISTPLASNRRRCVGFSHGKHYRQ